MEMGRRPRQSRLGSTLTPCTGYGEEGYPVRGRQPLTIETRKYLRALSSDDYPLLQPPDLYKSTSSSV